MEGGSLGFQIGASEMDIVTLVMNENGMRRLLQSTFTLGAKHGRNSIMVPISRSLCWSIRGRGDTSQRPRSESGAVWEKIIQLGTR